MKDFRGIVDFPIRIYFDMENMTNVYTYTTLNV